VDVVAHDLAQHLGAAEVGPFRDPLHLLDQLRGEGGPHVGRDEHLLELLEEIAVDLLFAEEHLVDVPHEALLGLREPLLEPLEERALLLRVSEHGPFRQRKIRRPGTPVGGFLIE